MANLLRQAQAPTDTGNNTTPNSEEHKTKSYWASLNQTVESDEYEVMLPKEVRGIRRSGVHKKI